MKDDADIHSQKYQSMTKGSNLVDYTNATCALTDLILLLK